ncbi:MAG: TPR repeat-containing protein YrrB [Verrucomicrobia subdivision 3 bacterium]|nr:TPR repeat-containing protein YrrB [Limisphaerales bacterium]MCS1414632.1 TPR repeat-containing protein YrrB [Limisphaerales bacterium]
MSSKPSIKKAGGIPVLAMVLVLVATVVVIFLVVFKSSRPTNSPSEAATKVQIQEEFIEVMNTGKNYLDQGRTGAKQAIESFQRALRLNPGDRDAALNLANSFLIDNQGKAAAKAAEAAIEIDRQSAAGHYLLGCSLLRLGRFEEALQSLQVAKDLDHTINAVSFQLGRAHQALDQFEAAAVQFREVIQFDPEHGAAFYNLSQVLRRLGDEAGAEEALARHQVIAEQQGAVITNPSIFERCVHTEARLPFKLDQPDLKGVSVEFVEATSAILGEVAEQFEGPVGVLDIGHDGSLDLFVRNKAEGFQLLLQRDGTFIPEKFSYPVISNASYTKCLIGDLQHKTSLMGGRQEDIILLSDLGTQVFRVSTSGMLSDASSFAQIAGVSLGDAVLTDFDLTGKLDILGLNSTNRSLIYLRNQGNFSFIDQTSATNLPSSLENVQQMVLEDWDGDDLLDLCLLRSGEAPKLWLRQRGAGLSESGTFQDLPVSRAVALGDLNNDLRADAVVASADGLAIKLQGGEELITVPTDTTSIRQLRLLDYDNDGWLDVLAIVNGGLRMWRNRGLEGLVETTEAVGFGRVGVGQPGTLKAADLDGDCDTDLLLTLTDQSLRVLRNDGGNQNQQLKLRLEGNRSNPSALGVKLEVTSGGLRMVRMIRELPVEIGLGKRQRVDAIDPHWSDLVTTTDFALEGCEVLVIPELELPTGSCPYLYVWDGERFRFVTDLLGAAPLGLPMAAGKLIPADTDEFVRLGDEHVFKPLDGDYVLQVTEELREVLYLDEAKLYAVDHPKGVEVHPTNKLVPGPPFPVADLMAVHAVVELQRAVRSDGLDVTENLRRVDGKMASPVALRAPQLRGLAEAFYIDLDFGAIDSDRPLVLVLNGWLRFGGGMANIGASHHPDLPFPFPVMSVELDAGSWTAVDVVVGAPAGKTKSIVVDLEGKLPVGARRIRLAMGFEIHWDRIVLMEKYRGDDVVQHVFKPSEAELHWRGFSEYQDLPWERPLSPDYGRVKMKAPWLITPSGWCTRYGDVNDLVDAKDDRLVILNGGDELTLRFPADSIPKQASGMQRNFYLFTSGWDKDADPHVVKGWTVEPIPWHGMDDQRYGEQPRPDTVSSDWQEEYNTRWVGQFTLRRSVARDPE